MAVGHAGGHVVGLAGMGDDADAVAQPFDRRTRHEDRAFLRIGRLAVQPVGDGGQQPVLGDDRRIAGVDQREAAGAVGRFRHARRQAGLPEGRRLLVARHAGNGNRPAEQFRVGLAEIVGAVEHPRQHGARHAEQRQQFVVPILGMDVEQHGARGVGRVGRMHAPAGQVVDQETVDGAEAQLATLGPRAGPRHMVEDPGDLGGGEIGVDQQAGLGAYQLGMAGGHQLLAERRGAAVLPDDGTVDRFAGGAVPHHGGLALVGDADGGDAGNIDPGLLHGPACHGPDVAQNVGRVMLDPAVAGIMLRKLAPRLGQRRPPTVEQDRPRRGGALIDGEDMAGLAHGCVSS